MKTLLMFTKSVMVVGAALQFALAHPGPDNAQPLATSVPVPASVGTSVALKAVVSGQDPGAFSWRFRVRPPGAPSFRMVRDFSPEPAFDWSPFGTDGTYDVEITAKNRVTGETSTTFSQYRIEPRAAGVPVITPTANELVFLYSAPPCPQFSMLRVMYWAPDGPPQYTPEIPCSNGRTINVYLAGLRAGTAYSARQIVTGSTGTTYGPELIFDTRMVPWTPQPTTAQEKRLSATDQGVLLQSRIFEYNTASDLDGNLVWYCPKPIRYLTRPVPGGYFLGIMEKNGGAEYEQKLQQLDLACNVVFETNAEAVSDQLERMGKRRITSFHHEAVSLPEGRIMVLAANEQVLTDVQGPGEVDVIGDMILVLNSDLQVEWAWDAFDHMDVRRAALLGETCVPGGGGCPEFRLRPTANDWLHGNSLQLTPDGDILYSARHQDWIIKIDYARGTGSGVIKWRLGKDGDFRMLSDDPWPWFSHQHDAGYESGDRIVLFDNGNVRQGGNASAHSRGQVLRIDESSRTAYLELNADLGDYALALGSACRLDDGNYHFNLGWTPDGLSWALEFSADGKRTGAVMTKTQQYRSFRMKSLYEQ